MLRLISFLIFFCSASIAFSQITLEDANYQDHSFEDLQFLKEAIGERSIVCLGEEWHFTETFSQVKNRLVKFLHQEMGFEVIIFEASLAGAWAAEKNGFTGKERLLETLPTIWRTESVLDLMHYLDQSKTGDFPMIQYGIDLNGVYTEHFALALKSYLQSNAVDLQDEILRIEKTIQEDWEEEHLGKLFFKSKLTSEDIESYQKLLPLIVRDDSFADPESKSIFLKCIENRVALAQKMLSNNKWFREEAMTKNLEWILSNVAKDKKVIIWAADIHISKSQKKTVKDGNKSMIELLSPEWRNEVYSMSLIPVSSTPKKLSKKLNSEPHRFFFYPLHEENELQYRGEEFDGVIVCKRPESIANFRIE